MSADVDSLPPKREIERAVGGVPGVRSLDVEDLHVIPAPVPEARILRAARRLRETVAELFPEERVELAYFGGAAVLAGAIGSLRARRAIVEFVADDRAVSRVVDKLEVRS